MIDFLAPEQIRDEKCTTCVDIVSLAISQSYFTVCAGGRSW
jgi:hypothetical protein